MIQELDRLNIDAYHEIVECITSALDARDPYTAGHSERVSDLAQMICGEMGITGECQNDIHVAAHLHDIGKIGIPDGRKNKGKMLFHLRQCMSGRKLRQWTVCQKPAGSRYHAPGRPPDSGTSEWYAGKRGGLSSDGGRFRDDRPEKETADPADRILCRVNSIKNQQKKLNQRLSAENESM